MLFRRGGIRGQQVRWPAGGDATSAGDATGAADAAAGDAMSAAEIWTVETHGGNSKVSFGGVNALSAKISLGIYYSRGKYSKYKNIIWD